MLMDMSLRDFCALLASKEPAPGGGSVSAFAGVLAASLGQMAVNLTVGKKVFESADDIVKEAVNEAGAELAGLGERLTKLVDDDTEAFNAYMTSFKMPKASDEEKNARKKALSAAEEVIVSVPLATFTACSEIFPHLATLAVYGNKNCISDVAVAANMALSGMEGGMYNVLTNKMHDGKRTEYTEKMTRMLNEAAVCRDKIINTAKEIFNE
ncbi:MAG: cyclodeaminase/cyclohydrolase family protein [Defluviitaleaceae bacterium]|nr:cyclodeaminase/cyclohydrolase family protein [Defluviitaleaceae bacterium]MCL2836437.1 cyclodeaminase/cyclohydrolase family protein [Defluviitaleaceae bacterium]